MKNVIGVLALALLPAVAAAADKPDWAFPVTEKVVPPPRFEGGRVRPAPPGSTLSITRAKADDMYDIPNWFPERYPSMPKIVQFGNKERRCALADRVISRTARVTTNPHMSRVFRPPISFARWPTGRAATASSAPPW